MGTFLASVGVFTIYLLLSSYGHRKKLHHHYTRACKLPLVEENDLVFKGRNAGIDNATIHSILTKRFHYYQSLSADEQKRFRGRVGKFMRRKIFIVKNTTGFKEMPVLVSAAAIQLSFGLPYFLLPFYKYIRIYPKEYQASHTIYLLTGNVKENTISVAWNHLLQGYNDVSDGCNVGLHEMSHALYFQKMVIEKEYATRFEKKYKQLIAACEEAHCLEKKVEKDLYSAYAEASLQEFWAETTELFFEKPHTLYTQHPAVYLAMKDLLNQNPLQNSDPVIKKRKLISL